ncbi:hypothetical protein C7N43_31610 [Sphingobacteriales bacterium UPWRP_1]|nr:hypothetical protein BVG80_01595 [Sphingobacteriales bacterium TSM_CSM]PSJ72941.1 hypothetical protein C7N43_31610 [Sphingobacteriales bacterium UPWRP_1]
MSKLRLLKLFGAVWGFVFLILTQPGCDFFCKDSCKDVVCTAPVVNSPSYYNNQYELTLSWTEEANTAYMVTAYMPALQQVIAYDVQGGNATLQLAQLYPLTLAAETECCEEETQLELSAACNYPDFFSVTLSPPPVEATFEWSAVSGATEYLITVYDSLGNNIQQIAVAGVNTSVEVALEPTASYAVIQTLCENGEYSPPSPPVRTTQSDPIAASVDVEIINSDFGVWGDRTTLQLTNAVQIVELWISNPPTGTKTYTVQTSYDNGSSWSVAVQPTKYTASGSNLLLPRFTVSPGTNSVIIEVVVK